MVDVGDPCDQSSIGLWPVAWPGPPLAALAPLAPAPLCPVAGLSVAGGSVLVH